MPEPASGLQAPESECPTEGDVSSPLYRSGRSSKVVVSRGLEEMELFATDAHKAATGIDVVLSIGENAPLLQDAIVRVYAEVSGEMVLCPESVRSIVNVAQQQQRITFVRNRACKRFRATIQGRNLAAIVSPPAVVYARYSLTGQEVHPENDPQQVTVWTPPPGVSGNVGVLRSGAGACLQAYFVNAGAAQTYVMLFFCPVYPAAAPAPGDPHFAVLPVPGGGGVNSFDFVRGGELFLNGVSFGCSTNPAAYVVDAAAAVTGFAETT